MQHTHGRWSCKLNLVTIHKSHAHDIMTIMKISKNTRIAARVPKDHDNHAKCPNWSTSAHGTMKIIKISKIAAPEQL